MKGIILAAGISSRLRPLTDRAPKCLLSVGGATILERTLNNLLANNVEDVVIVTGYLEHQVREFVAERFPKLKVKFISNQDFASTNNIYSLWLTKQDVINDDILLLDSDIIFDERIIRRLLRAGHDNCLAVKRMVALSDEEIKVAVDANHRILAISKEVPAGQAGGESIGIEKFSSSFLEALFAVMDRKIGQEQKVNEFYEAAFQETIDRGYDVFAVDIGKYRAIEIDTIEDIVMAEKDVIPYLPAPSAARADSE